MEFGSSNPFLFPFNFLTQMKFLDIILTNAHSSYKPSSCYTAFDNWHFPGKFTFKHALRNKLNPKALGWNKVSLPVKVSEPPTAVMQYAFVKVAKTPMSLLQKIKKYFNRCSLSMKSLPIFISVTHSHTRTNKRGNEIESGTLQNCVV